MDINHQEQPGGVGVTIKTEVEDSDIDEPILVTPSDSLPTMVPSKTATVYPLQTNEVPAMGAIPTSVADGIQRLPHPPQQPEKPVKPLELYRKQAWDSIKQEFPQASKEDLNGVIGYRWDMLKEEDKKVFEDEYEREKIEYQKALAKFFSSREYKTWMDAKSSLENALSCRINLPRVTMMTENEEEDLELEQNSKKVGPCTWCKNIGKLSDFTTTLHGKEIYCTGLCSHKCFQEAAQKICNVERGTTTLIRYSGEQRTAPFHVPASNIMPLVQKSQDQSGASNIANAGNINTGVQNEQSQYNVIVNSFNWTQYLTDTASSASPLSCFKQPRVASVNGFKSLMKLEAEDPRQDSAICIASVVAALGPRIRLRFDGCDQQSDIWRMPDSGEVHPVGWCEGNKRMLQPPVGFRWDAHRFHDFLQKNLRDAELAPMKLFKKEPPTPFENTFQIGQKLEAVDKSNPALICVATVTELDRHRIKIEFDGYKGSGYWTNYFDRDLFPVGWSYTNGYPLQPPGKKVLEKLQSRDASPRPFTSTSTSSGPTDARSITQQTISAKEKKYNSASSADVHINFDCDPGPYLNPSKIVGLPKTYRGDYVPVLQTILEDIIKCAYEPKTVFGFLKPGRGNVAINCHCGGVTYKCYLSNVDRVSQFWKVMEQFLDNLRCCPNLICGFEMSQACSNCGKLGGSSSRQQLTGKRTASSSSLASSSSRSLTPGAATGSEMLLGEDAEGSTKKRSRRDFSLAIEINGSPRSWSVDDVYKFIEQTDLKDYAPFFRANEIDGKALLLLKREIIINYMKLKIGPAVKLLELIEELKEAQEKFR